MKLSTRILVSASALAIIGGWIVTGSPVSAHGGANNNLAHALAVRFNLNEKDVRNFLDEYNQDKSDKTVSTEQSDHVAFIDAKLSQGVSDGWLTKSQKKDVMAKLKEMMHKSPSSTSFASMNSEQQTDAINNWKKDMRKWAIAHNLTLDQIRNLTGKGNKYLMGIELD